MYHSLTPLSLFSAFFLLVNHADAHWYLSYIAPAGESLPEGSNMPPYNKGHGDNGFLQTAPVAPADTNPIMKCGTMGVPGDSISALQVDAGAALTAQFLHDTNVPWDQGYNSNHHGFTSVYISPHSARGEGEVWTKIYSDGYHPEITQDQIPDWTDPSKNDECKPDPGNCRWVGWWAIDIVRYNEGKFDFTLPASVPAGKYILRAEMLGTYLADTVSTAQSYVGCSVIQVGAGGGGEAASTTLPNAVAFPAAYAGHPWMTYSLYANYPNNIPDAPGPEVWNGSEGGSTNSQQDQQTHSPSAKQRSRKRSGKAHGRRS